MDLDQMRHIAEVARTGSVSAAARSLHVSQPTLSRSLKRLEAELGLELFDRTANRAELNGAGRVVVDAARDMLGVERRMRGALDELSRRARAVKVASVAPAPTWNLAVRVICDLAAKPQVAHGVTDGVVTSRRAALTLGG